jgi:hypothetical protein
VALHTIRHPKRLGRTILLDGIPIRMSELKAVFERLEASRDTASRRRLQEAEAAMRAHPEDPAACRTYNAIWFYPFFIEPGGPVSRRLDVCSGSGAGLRNGVRNIDRYTFPSLGDYDWRHDMIQVQAPTLVMRCHPGRDRSRMGHDHAQRPFIRDARLRTLSVHGGAGAVLQCR